MDIDSEMDDLIRNEGLDDIDKLLRPREWDEVPLFSRYDRISFLSGMSVHERCRLLVTAAVKHLDYILAGARKRGLDNILVLVSITDWADYHAAHPEVVQPNFWICTNFDRDLRNFFLRLGVSKEANTTAAWLRSGDLLIDHDVYEQPSVTPDNDLYRVYIGKRDSLALQRFIRPN